MTVAPEEVRRRPVGVFDSGVGGLTVLHELLVRLPHEDYVYLADSARLPYGTRPPEQLRQFALEVAEALIARSIKLLVVACNSATAAALPALRERLMQTTLGVEVLGVVQPAAVQAVAATRRGKVGVLGTPATVPATYRCVRYHSWPAQVTQPAGRTGRTVGATANSSSRRTP